MKPAFPLRGKEPVFGADLASKEKQALADRLRSRPYEYVAQEQIALSTAPIWDRGRMESRSVVLRTYVLKRGFLDGRLGFVLAVYVAEGTYYRYLKMSPLGQDPAIAQMK